MYVRDTLTHPAKGPGLSAHPFFGSLLVYDQGHCGECGSHFRGRCGGDPAQFRRRTSYSRGSGSATSSPLAADT